MRIGFIGLGKMGCNMACNLVGQGYEVVGYNKSHDGVKKAVRKGVVGAYSVEEFFSTLGSGKKVIWLMVPSSVVDDVLGKLKGFLRRGDIIIDGGNSYFEDSRKRYNELKKLGVDFLDCGVSGGVEGARRGSCMMVGGDFKVFKKVEKLFKDLCVKDSYGYVGSNGAGHFVKMVHNGIEYGMMGAINEGFKGLEKHSAKFGLDLREIAMVYSHGSIIESRLMSWLYDSLLEENYLDNVSCEVPLGETENEMKKLEKLADMKILHEARLMRERSRRGTVCGDFIAAMRNKFGGHSFKKRR